MKAGNGENNSTHSGKFKQLNWAKCINFRDETLTEAEQNPLLILGTFFCSLKHTLKKHTHNKRMRNELEYEKNFFLFFKCDNKL